MSTRPTSCFHHFCRTSLDDETAVYCPHGRAFCDGCTWEEACEDCLLEPLRQRAAAIWDAASDSRPPTLTPADEWAGWWGEQARDERALPHADPRMDDRAADDYYEKRWGA